MEGKIKEAGLDSVEAKKTDQGKSFLPIDFEVGDLSPLPEGEFTRRIEKDFIFPFNNENYKGSIVLERHVVYPSSNLDSVEYPVSIVIDLTTENGDKAAHFRGNIQVSRLESKYRFDDAEHCYCHIGTRRIEKEHRRKGLGETCLATFEDLVRKIGKAYPDLRSEWLQLDTSLASLSRLISDPGWLRENRLPDLISPSGRNLGFRPFSVDIPTARMIVQQKTEEVADIVGRHLPQVRFFKKI